MGKFVDDDARVSDSELGQGWGSRVRLGTISTAPVLLLKTQFSFSLLEKLA